MKTLTVHEVMTRMPVSVGPTTSVEECAKKMLKEGVGSVLVLENGMIKGILTEKDMTKAIAEEKVMKDVRVEEIMSRNVTTIQPEKDVLEAIRVMSEKEVRRLPVVDKQKLVGLITVSDILRVEPDMLEIIFEKQLISHGSPRGSGECEVCGNYAVLHESDGKRVCVDCE